MEGTSGVMAIVAQPAAQGCANNLAAGGEIRVER
jgi:hypothetical protein